MNTHRSGGGEFVVRATALVFVNSLHSAQQIWNAYLHPFQMYDGVTFQIESRDPGHALLGSFVIPMLVVDMAYLFTIFEDSGFMRSKQTKAPFTRYNLLWNRLSNRFE